MRTLVIVVVLLSLLPSPVRAQHTLLDLYIRGDYQAFADSVFSTPGIDPHFIFLAADGLRRMNRSDEAFQRFEQLSAVGGMWTYLGWSGAWHILGNRPNALLAAQWAADATPGWLLPQFQLAYMEYLNHLNVSAANRFESVRNQAPDFSLAWYYWALANLEIHDSGGPYTPHVQNALTGFQMFVQQRAPYCPRPEVFFTAVAVCTFSGGGTCGWNPELNPYCGG